MLLRGADRREHAELAEPPLRDDREACGGDERGEEEEDGGHGEHRQRVRRVGRFRRRRAPAKPDAAVGRPGRERRSRRSVARVDQNRRRGRALPRTRARRARTRRSACAGSRRCRRPSADDRRAPAGRSELEPQELRHAVGDGDLVAGPSGSCPGGARAARRRRRRRGSCARKSTVSTLPGTATERWPMTSIVPNDSSAAARPASSFRGSEPSNVSSRVGRAELGVVARRSRCRRS